MVLIKLEGCSDVVVNVNCSHYVAWFYVIHTHSGIDSIVSVIMILIMI